jgi:hypothetical protein
MKTTLSERKELLIKEIISLIKEYDYSKGCISFRDKIEINLKPLYRYSVHNLFLISISGKNGYHFNKEEVRYIVNYSYYYYENKYDECGLTLRQFKQLFNTLNILELIVIRVVIKQGSKT